MTAPVPAPIVPRQFRKKLIVIEAFRWVGGDYTCLNRFLGRNWSRADVVDMPMHDAEGVVVFNTKEQCWIPCAVGHWIIRGVAGEFYPCAPDVFDMTYEAIL